MDSAVQPTPASFAAVADLAARVEAGDAEAEGELLRQLQRGVRLLARRHCRANDPIAEDIAQDVLFTLVERVRNGAISDPLALPAYARTMVVHAASAEYRRRRTQEDVLAQAHRLAPPMAHPEPPEQMHGERVASAFRALLDELPIERDRELLRRFYLQEQGKAEVCAALDIDAEHFHRVLHRARQRFRDVLLRAGLAPTGVEP